MSTENPYLSPNYPLESNDLITYNFESRESEDLIRMLTTPEDYTPEALMEAKLELARRGIEFTPAEFESVTNNSANSTSNVQINQPNTGNPYTHPEKLLALLCLILIVFLPIQILQAIYYDLIPLRGIDTAAGILGANGVAFNIGLIATNTVGLIAGVHLYRLSPKGITPLKAYLNMKLILEILQCMAYLYLHSSESPQQDQFQYGRVLGAILYFAFWNFYIYRSKRFLSTFGIH